MELLRTFLRRSSVGSRVGAILASNLETRRNSVDARLVSQSLRHRTESAKRVVRRLSRKGKETLTRDDTRKMIDSLREPFPKENHEREKERERERVALLGCFFPLFRRLFAEIGACRARGGQGQSAPAPSQRVGSFRSISRGVPFPSPVWHPWKVHTRVPTRSPRGCTQKTRGRVQKPLESLSSLSRPLFLKFNTQVPFINVVGGGRRGTRNLQGAALHAKAFLTVERVPHERFFQLATDGRALEWDTLENAHHPHKTPRRPLKARRGRKRAKVGSVVARESARGESHTHSSFSLLYSALLSLASAARALSPVLCVHLFIFFTFSRHFLSFLSLFFSDARGPLRRAKRRWVPPPRLADAASRAHAQRLLFHKKARENVTRARGSSSSSE